MYMDASYVSLLFYAVILYVSIFILFYYIILTGSGSATTPIMLGNEYGNLYLYIYTLHRVRCSVSSERAAGHDERRHSRLANLGFVDDSD